MSKGKFAAMAGHAFLDAYVKADPERVQHYDGTKVVLEAESLEHLQLALEVANCSGIPAALVTDSVHVMPPHFDGSPIVVSLGIGPATRAEVKHITKQFKLSM